MLFESDILQFIKFVSEKGHSLYCISNTLDCDVQSITFEYQQQFIHCSNKIFTFFDKENEMKFKHLNRFQPTKEGRVNPKASCMSYCCNGAQQCMCHIFYLNYTDLHFRKVIKTSIEY